MWAAENSHASIVRTLIKAQADVNLRDQATRSGPLANTKRDRAYVPAGVQESQGAPSPVHKRSYQEAGQAAAAAATINDVHPPTQTAFEEEEATAKAAPANGPANKKYTNGRGGGRAPGLSKGQYETEAEAKAAGEKSAIAYAKRNAGRAKGPAQPRRHGKLFRGIVTCPINNPGVRQWWTSADTKNNVKAAVNKFVREWGMDVPHQIKNAVGRLVWKRAHPTWPDEPDVSEGIF
mmetsp:Transcript_8805/g.14955  ORF Transcript_8805/g.14955 Transcript_8805/m.14955 type:complete len:235 (-) Transcript_8805:73-777(-)